MTRPRLSICLPTYNRADLLHSALYALAPQLRVHHPAVELVVCDNASTDHTPEVITRWGEEMPLRAYRNDENLGFYGNLFRLTQELAQGEYAWVIGDDDIVRGDGVARILAVLRDNPTVDYVFVNTTPLKHVERLNKGALLNGDDFPDLYPLKCNDLSQHPVEKWEMLIDPQVDETFLGAAMVSVFRLSRWQDVVNSIDIDAGQGHRLNYFNAEILARALKGRPAYYLGYPCTIAFSGGQAWNTFVPIVVLVLQQDLLDSYLRAGIDRERIALCRDELLWRSREAMRTLLSGQEFARRDQFSWRHFLWQNRRHLRQLWTVYREATRPTISLAGDEVRDYSLSPEQHTLTATPLVSVVILADDNANPHVTLESIYAQTYPNYEVIVVSDKPIDSGAVRSVSASGSRATRWNAGVAAAQGDFIAFVEAGDTLAADKLAVQVAYFANYPEIGLCYTAYHQGADYIRTNERAGRAYRHLLRYGSDIQTSTVMVSRAALDAVGGFDPDFDAHEGQALWLRIAREYAIAMTTQSLTQAIERPAPPLDATYHLLFWQKTFQLNPDISRRVRAEIMRPLYFRSVHELYTHWPQNRGRARHTALKALLYNPALVFRPALWGLMVRTIFPQTLYKRLRPIWQRILRTA